MVKGFGSQIEDYNKNFTAIGGMEPGQQFGSAPVKLMNNVAGDSLRPLQQDTMQLEGQYAEMPPQEPMFDMATLPLWFVLGKGVDFYNSKCSGEYINSLPAKLGRLGDRIAGSKLATNSFVQGIGTKVTQAKDVAMNRWRNGSNVLRNLMDLSTIPEWEMPKATMFTQEQELANEVKHQFERYLNAGGKKPALKNLVPSSAEKEFIKNVLGTSGVSEIDKVNCLQLHRANPAKYKDALSVKSILSQRAANPQIIKETLLKELGYDLKTFEKYTANPSKYAKELRAFAAKAGQNMKVYHGNYNIVGALFRRKTDMSQIANKMFSISKDAIDATGKHLPPTTALGRGMSKTMQGLMRGLTFGGGKLGLLIFVAPTLVDTFKNAKEAPDDQKLATLVHGGVESVSWVAAFPWAMKLMHKIGGLRYLGMTKNQVSMYRDALTNFHEINKAGGFATKAEYFKAWEKVKALRTPSSKLNIFEKALKGVGNLLTQDLEMRHAWKNPAAGTIKNALRGKSIGNFFRHGIGAAGKFALFMGVAMPFVSKLIEKPIEWIFGKPYDRHEEAEKKAAAAALNPEVQQMPQPVVSPVDTAIDNFNKRMEARKAQEVQQQPTAYVKSQNEVVGANDRYIPAQTCDIPRDSGEFNERTYIPGQDSQVVKLPEEINGLNIIEQRAKLAEQNAIDILSRRP